MYFFTTLAEHWIAALPAVARNDSLRDADPKINRQGILGIVSFNETVFRKFYSMQAWPAQPAQRAAGLNEFAIKKSSNLTQNENGLLKVLFPPGVARINCF